MQPTEHKQPTEEELIAHIRQSLMAHEETYEVGAWEKFNGEQQPKKTPFLWIRSLGGIAALLALAFAIFLITKQNPEEQGSKITKTNSAPITEQPKDQPLTNQPTVVETQKESKPEIFKESADQGHVIANTKQEEPTKHDVTTPSTVIVAANTNNTTPTNQQVVVSTVNENVATVTTPKTDPQQVAKIAEEKAKPNIIDFLNKETEKEKAKPQSSVLDKRASRWELGVLVAPSFGNTKKLNMGYGVSMEYSLSDKLSLSSGIAYNEMTDSKSATPSGLAYSPSSAAFVQDSKNLESTSEKVIGLDIPLELKYHISNSIYANFGVSAFAVLDYQRNNTYLEKKLVPNYLLGGGAGSPNSPIVGGGLGNEASFTNSMFVNQRTTEPAPESSKNGSNYIGFYNLSVGYKKKISKNNAVSIEPFMKLPMKEVSKDNLRLIGTGLRLKFDF